MSEHQQAIKPEREEAPTTPQVWIGSLADYVAGKLVGAWIDANQEPDELQQAIQDVLASSGEPGAEEWAIFDHEGFNPFQLGTNEDVRIISAVAKGITEHGEAFASWAELHDGDLDMLAHFQDAYLGHFASAADFGQQLLDDFEVEAVLDREVPEWIRRHVQVDIEGLADDMALSGDVWIEEAPSGGIYVFDTRA